MANPRKPKAKKILEGTWRKDRNPVREPEYVTPESGEVKPPAGLNRWAKKFWKDHFSMLTDSGVLTVADLPQFHQLCLAWGNYCEADYAIHHGDDGTKRTTVEYRKERGYSRQYMPEMIERRESFDQFCKLCQQFGMTPASRNKIDLAPKNKEEISDTERIMNEVNGG